MTGTKVLGLVLVIAGSLFTLDSLGWIHLSWGYLWPLFLLLPGIAFHAAFFAGRNQNAGLLVPGGILTVYGLLFSAMTIFGWQLMEVFWPVFILGVALGLFELYVFGPRETGLLIPVGILSLVGFAFLFINLLHTGGSVLVGLALILAGGAVILKGSGLNTKK